MTPTVVLVVVLLHNAYVYLMSMPISNIIIGYEVEACQGRRPSAIFSPLTYITEQTYVLFCIKHISYGHSDF